jgi:hypothetical protein
MPRVTHAAHTICDVMCSVFGPSQAPVSDRIYVFMELLPSPASSPCTICNLAKAARCRLASLFRSEYESDTFLSMRDGSEFNVWQFSQVINTEGTELSLREL